MAEQLLTVVTLAPCQSSALHQHACRVTPYRRWLGCPDGQARTMGKETQFIDEIDAQQLDLSFLFMGLFAYSLIFINTLKDTPMTSAIISQATHLSSPIPFHLAFPVCDLAEARAFYGELLGCPEGRSSDAWIDFNFFGHQIVAHLAPEECGHRSHSAVDGHDVPVRHFGAVVPMDLWQAMADKLTARGTDFVIKPYIRFKGEPGEQATMFFLDPSGNAVEMKSFADLASLFAK